MTIKVWNEMLLLLAGLLMLRKSLAAFILVIGSLFVSTSYACLPGQCTSWKAAADLPAFLTVSPELCRGGQPSVDGLRQLKERGIKTIISLRHNRPLAKLESAEAGKLGLRFISIPMTGLQKPTDSEISQFLQIVNDKENQPAYVHCQFGVDRTGTMVGIYRIAKEHWTADQAYREMVHDGFHPMFAWLADAVFDFEEKISGTGLRRNKPLGVKLLDSFETTKSLFKSNHRHATAPNVQPLS